MKFFKRGLWTNDFSKEAAREAPFDVLSALWQPAQLGPSPTVRDR